MLAPTTEQEEELVVELDILVESNAERSANRTALSCNPQSRLLTLKFRTLT
jgi:hypothetical protein